MAITKAAPAISAGVKRLEVSVWGFLKARLRHLVRPIRAAHPEFLLLVSLVAARLVEAEHRPLKVDKPRVGTRPGALADVVRSRAPVCGRRANDRQCSGRARNVIPRAEQYSPPAITNGVLW